MNTSITEIVIGVSWANDQKLFFIGDNSGYNVMLFEYLSCISHSISSIDEEIDKLNGFNTANDKEKYIMEELSGFSTREDGFFAKIGGFDDFSIMVLYDIKENRTFLQHVYGVDKLTLKLADLISLLQIAKAVKTALANNL